MSESITNKFQSFINENSDNEYPNYLMPLAWLMANFKIEDLQILDLRKESSIASYFLIGTSLNSLHASSFAKEAKKQLAHTDAKVYSMEGMDKGEWILMDLGEVIIHIFNQEQRDIYQLKKIWPMAGEIKIPEKYYYSISNEDSFNKVKRFNEYF